MEIRQHGLKEPLSNEPNPLVKIPQTGYVILEDDVEVGGNACIDRATMGATVIGSGTKIDDMVMVAHNVRMGRECIVVAGAMVAGSSVLGDRVILAGQAGLKDHVRIGNDAIVQGQAGVMTDIEELDVVVGSPAMPYRDFFTMVAVQQKLPAMRKEVKNMQKRIEQLEKALLERQLETPAAPAKKK
jgi:UDP-3-O-[3-hydroxymyristoyl] glucosamine N-acyltransferase